MSTGPRHHAGWRLSRPRRTRGRWCAAPAVCRIGDLTDRRCSHGWNQSRLREIARRINH